MFFGNIRTHLRDRTPLLSRRPTFTLSSLPELHILFNDVSVLQIELHRYPEKQIVVQNTGT